MEAERSTQKQRIKPRLASAGWSSVIPFRPATLVSLASELDWKDNDR